MEKQQQQQQALLEFQAGVTAVLRAWSPFKTAATQEWGGVDSFSKAEALRLHIYEHYNGDNNNENKKKLMEVYELEDNLVLYMEEEFSLILEDDSERHVANDIVQMYLQCSQGVFTLVREMVAVAERIRLQQQGSSHQNNQVQIISQGEMDDDEEDELPPEQQHLNSIVPMPIGNQDGTHMFNSDNSTLMTNNNVVHVASITNTTILEYATGALFENNDTYNNNGKVKKEKKVMDAPRQLGEDSAMTTTKDEQMDEDGFVVHSSRKTRK